MFFEPLTCCSIGAAIDCATTVALAPGNEVETSTCGGTICGYCVIGSPSTATPPASEMISEITRENRPVDKEIKHAYFAALYGAGAAASLPGSLLAAALASP